MSWYRFQSTKRARARHSLRVKPITDKRRDGVTGEEYVFTFRNQQYRLPGHIRYDQTSPDGIRWIATPASAKVIRMIVCELAERRCELKLSESCWGFLPLNIGHAHHLRRKKMGGAFTDDRIWILGQRVRFWTCPTCHRHEDGDLQWSKRQ